MSKRTIKITLNSPIVLGFAFLCLISLLIGLLTGGKSTQTFFMVYRSPLSSPLTYLRFFTHVLGHSGWEHFIGNMSFILLLGPVLEEKYSSEKLIGVILMTALVTGLICFIFFPNVALCGASGVVFAFILLASFVNFKNGEIPITFILVALIYLGQEIYNGVFVNDNVAQFAHVIGGIVGAVAGYYLNTKGTDRR